MKKAHASQIRLFAALRLALFALASFGFALSASAAVNVTKVTAKQRYPWNGLVDVSYTVTGAQSGVSYSVFAEAAATDGAYTVATTTGEGRPGAKITPNGAESKTYSFVWDMAKDNPARPKTDNLTVRVLISGTVGNYMRVDLDTGDVAYLNFGPDINNDECRSNYLWLREILAAGQSFEMGAVTGELGQDTSSNNWVFEDKHTVSFTKNFYIGVFEVTQDQWEKVGKTNSSASKSATRPVEQVTWDDVRGSSAGANWPGSNAVDATSFLGKLRKLTRDAGYAIDFDLPTDAQWEYACRAGTTTSLNNGTNLAMLTGIDPNLGLLGRYANNQKDGQGGNYTTHTVVGSYLPNAWGLYDMHGNVFELCLDWFTGHLGNDPVTDPVGPQSSSPANTRVMRSGQYNGGAGYCRSAFRFYYTLPSKGPNIGFRVAFTLPASTAP